MKKTLNKPQRGHADAGLEVGSGLHRELRYLYSLAELNLLIAQGMAAEELGWLVVTAIPSLLEVPFAALALDEAEDGNWQVIGQHDKRPLDAATAQEVTSLMADGLANRALSLIGCLMLSDLPEASGTVPEPLTKLGLKSALVVAVRTTRNKFGVLMVGSEMAENYNSTQRFLIGTVANQIAVSLENASLLNRAQESEERYMQLFEGISDAVMVYGSQGSFLDCNEATLQRLGYSRDEFLRLEPADIVHPDFHLKMKDNLEMIWAGETTVVESAHRCKDGRFIPVEAHACRIEYGGQPAILAVVRDITERKRAEGALRESEKQASAAIEAARALTFVYDIATGKINWGGTIEEITGQTPEEFAQIDIQGWAERIHPDDRDEILAILQEAMGKDRATAEYRFKTKKGYVTLSSISITEKQDGKPVRLVGILQDITERKRAEEALQQRTYDLGERIKELSCLYGTSTLIEKQDISPEELFQRTIDLIPPAWQYPEITCARIILDGQEFTTENFRETMWKQTQEIIVHGDRSGTLEVCYLEEKPQIDEGPFLREERSLINAIAKLLGEATERKRMEEALRQSEKKYRELVDTLNEGIWRIDKDAFTTYVNPKMAEILGYTIDEMLGKHLFSFMDERGVEIAGLNLERRRQGISEQHDFEFIHKDGTRIYTSIATNPITDANGNYIGALAGVQDITERKRAEEALRESEERYRQLVSGLQDAYTIFQEGKIVFANEKLAEVSGYDLRELISMDIAGLSPPRLRKRAEALFEQVLRGETLPERVEGRILNKNGVIAPVEVSFKSFDYEGKPSIGALFRDITERKRADEEIGRHAKRVEALHTVAQTVGRTRDLDKLLNEALAKVLDVMDVDAGGIYLLDLQNRASVAKAYIGVSEETVAGIGRIEMSEQELSRIVQCKEPVLESDKVFSEANLTKIAEVLEKEGLRDFIIVPFSSKDTPLGALVIADRGERRFSAEDIELLQAIGNEIAVGIENARLLERTRELSVTDELTGLYNRRHFYKMLETEVHRAQRYDRSFSLVMLDIDGFKEYNDRFGHTNGDVVLQSLAQNLKLALRKSDTAFRYGGDEFTIILPATESDRAKLIIDRIRSKWLQTPKLQYPTLENPLGYSAGIAQFPENAETADGLVFLADTALYHAKRQGGYGAIMVSDLEALSSDIRSTATLDQVYALAATVDAKDPHTYGHSTRVATIAETIGKAIGLSEKGLADLYVAALLHDIGKIGVPDAILTKPGALIEDEWRIVKKHSAEGARIFSYARELRASVPMILHHHEWYDGKGYPNGLKGEEIPLGARIISIADAYDTMTTPRLYRDVISHKEACEELRRCSRTQFDHELVEAFCQVTDEDNRQN